MVNYIYIDADGHKRARRVTNREDYLTLRNTPDNCRHFAQGRAGGSLTITTCCPTAC